jgi:hypothetical protein
MISTTHYERVAETLGLRLEYNYRANCHTLSWGANAINGDLKDERFRRRLRDALTARALDFLLKTPESDLSRDEVVSFLNEC